MEKLVDVQCMIGWYISCCQVSSVLKVAVADVGSVNCTKDAKAQHCEISNFQVHRDQHLPVNVHYARRKQMKRTRPCRHTHETYGSNSPCSVP